jgi:hypothetical protein
VQVTSLTHRAGILNWHDKQSAAQYNPFTSYGLSKLANALTATELQRRISHAGSQWGADSAVSVHPGEDGKRRDARWVVTDSSCPVWDYPYHPMCGGITL